MNGVVVEMTNANEYMKIALNAFNKSLRNVSTLEKGYLTKAQVRALVASMKPDSKRPALQMLCKRGEYVYYTNRILLLRWDIAHVPEMMNVEDESMVSMQVLAEWLKLSDAKNRLTFTALAKAGAWEKPDGIQYPSVERLYKNVNDNAHVCLGVAFDPDYVSFMGSMMADGTKKHTGNTIIFKPTNDEKYMAAWKVFGSRDDVSGLLSPMRFLGEAKNPGAEIIRYAVSRDDAMAEDGEAQSKLRKTSKVETAKTVEPVKVLKPAVKEEKIAEPVKVMPEAKVAEDKTPEVKEPKTEKPKPIKKAKAKATKVVSAVVPVGSNTCEELDAMKVKPRRFGKLHNRVAYVAATKDKAVVAWKQGYERGSDLSEEARISEYLEKFGLKLVA
jgi:hypothetical protein